MGVHRITGDAPVIAFTSASSTENDGGQLGFVHRLGLGEVAFAESAISEEFAPDLEIPVDVERTGDASGTVALSVVVTGGTAVEDVDFSLTDPDLTWDYGESGTKSALVTLLDDWDDTKTIELGITDLVGAALGTPDELTITGVVFHPGVLDFTSATFSANEDAGTVAITVARSAGTDGAASVQVVVTGGTATGGGVDYTYSTATLTWLDGEGGNKSATVTLIDNLLDAPNKTVTFALQNPTVAALGSQTTTTLTIIDEDAAGTLQFNSSTGTVTAGSLYPAAVTRTGGSDNAVGVSYATANGTAIAGTDYTAASGTLSWADGDAANKTANVTTAARTARQFTAGSNTFRVYNDSFVFQAGTPSSAPPGLIQYSIAKKRDASQVAILSDNASSLPKITVYNPNGWVRLADPLNQPGTGNNYVGKFNPSGTRFVAAGEPNASGYGATSPARVFDSSVLPYVGLVTPVLTVGTGTIYGASWSPTENRLALSGASGVFILDTTADAYTQLSRPATNFCTACAYSPDGQYLAVGRLSPPYLSVFRTSDYTQVALGWTGLPAYQVAWNNAGTRLALGIGTSPFFATLDVSTWTLLAQPAVLPPNVPSIFGGGLAWRDDDAYVAIGHTTAPFFTLYDTSTNPYTKVANPASLPSDTVYSVEWIKDITDKTFTVTLSAPTGGAALGSPIVQTVTIGPS